MPTFSNQSPAASSTDNYLYSIISVDIEDSSYPLDLNTIQLTVNSTIYTDTDYELSLSKLANNTTPTFTSGGGTAGTCNITLKHPDDLEDEEWYTEFTDSTNYDVYRRDLGSSDSWVKDGSGTNGTTYSSSNRGIVINISGGSPSVGDKWEWSVYCGRKIWFFPNQCFSSNDAISCKVEADNTNGDSGSSNWAFNTREIYWEGEAQFETFFRKSPSLGSQYYIIFKKACFTGMQPYFIFREWFADGAGQFEVPVCEVFLWNIGGSGNSVDPQTFLVFGSGNVQGYWIENTFGSGAVRAYTIANIYGSGSITHLYIKNWAGSGFVSDLMVKFIGGSATVYGRTDTGLFIKLQIIPEELKQALEDVGVTFIK